METKKGKTMQSILDKEDAAYVARGWPVYIHPPLYYIRPISK